MESHVGKLAFVVAFSVAFSLLIGLLLVGAFRFTGIFSSSEIQKVLLLVLKSFYAPQVKEDNPMA